MKYIRIFIMVASTIMMGYELNYIFAHDEIDTGDIMSYKRVAVFLLIILLGFWGFYKDRNRKQEQNRL